MNFTPLSAQQIAQKTYQTVAGLSPDQQTTFKKNINIDDPLKILSEARSAKDLTAVSLPEYTSKNPDSPLAADNATDPTGIKILEYTDQNGNKVTVMVNTQSNLPQAIISTSQIHMPALNKVEIPATINCTLDGSTADNSTITANGQASVVIVDGRPYLIPEEVKGNTFKVELKDGDVYINGIKAIPQN
jgi:hypothetical protein